MPFAAYMIVFLGIPLYVVIHGSLTTESRPVHVLELQDDVVISGVQARVQEQPDPVSLDVCRRRRLRDMARGGGRHG